MTELKTLRYSFFTLQLAKSFFTVQRQRIQCAVKSEKRLVRREK
jgi:hypothetical protein